MIKKIICFLIGLIIGYLLFIPIINLKKDYDKIKKENKNLKKEITDYKWQLEQVPYVIESNIESWCNSGYK